MTLLPTRRVLPGPRRPAGRIQPPDAPAEGWEERVAALLRRPEDLRSVHQPVVDLTDGRCVGYEALVRTAEWPARSPEPLFAAAASAGLGGQLEAAALEASLRARITMPGDRFLTVNVSPAALAHPAVAKVFEDEDDVSRLLLSPTGVDDLADLPPPPAAEGVVTVPGPTPAQALRRLRGRGALLAAPVRDGGRRELSAVLALDPDVVALDAALVRDCHRDPVRARLLALVTELVTARDAVVLAEGVETPEEALHLRRAGVRLAQGWLFGRPRPGFQPPSAEFCTALKAPATIRTPVTAGDVAADRRRLATGWRVVLDRQGRLIAATSPDGSTVALSDLLRVRAGQQVAAAARRVLAAPPGRRRHPVVAVLDDAGAPVGLVERDGLLAAALDDPDSMIPTSGQATGRG